jgi:hypothetical protein
MCAPHPSSSSEPNYVCKARCGSYCIGFNPDKLLPNPYDPWQPPAWRWLRAGYLLEHHRKPLYRDDVLTWQVWHFRHRLEHCRGEADHAQLAADFPALADAHRAWIGPPLRRAELEARLLGGQPDVEIGSRCGLRSDAVAVYHDVFFEVRPHLQADVYILDVAIGWQPNREPKANDHDLLLKLFGHAGGGPAVDEYLDYLRNPPSVPASLDGLDLAELKRLRAKLDIKIMSLLLCTPAAALQPSQWMHLREQLRSLRSTGESDFATAISPMVDPIASLADAPQAMQGDDKNAYMATAIPA